MARTYEAIFNPDGSVTLLGTILLPTEATRAVFVVLDEPPKEGSMGPGFSRAQPFAPASERFETVRALGVGGMGQTWLARDLSTDQMVCLKSLNHGIDLSNLRQEASALRRLDHPGIARFLEMTEFNGRPTMVMEYIEGHTLADHVDLNPLMSVHQAVDLAVQLLEALQSAHDQGVLHCDLKPNNVLLERDGARVRTRIIDYGLAVVDHLDADDAVTAVGRIAGAPLYMTPEQIEGAMLAPSCDVYPVGQMLWEMLMGRPAFDGPPMSVFFKKVQRKNGLVLDDPPTPVSQAVRDIIEHITHREPTQRPTALEAARALRAACPPLPAGTVAAPVNMDFSWSEGSGAPLGWHSGVGFVHGVSAETRFEAGRFGPGVCLERREGDSGEFGVLMQRIPASHLVGRRLRLDLQARAQDIRGWAGAWMRGDSAVGTLFFDNMADRGISGSTLTSVLSIEAEVPVGMEWLCFGGLLVGSGRLMVESATLSVWHEGRWRALCLWAPTTPRPLFDNHGMMT